MYFKIMDTVNQKLEFVVEELSKRLQQKIDARSALEVDITSIQQALEASHQALLAISDPHIPIKSIKTPPVVGRYSGGKKTLKGMIMAALTTHFHDTGATTNELLAYFKDVHEKDILRSSLSPQLSRLKRDGFIVSRNHIWSLAPNNEALIVETEGEKQSSLINGEGFTMQE